MDNSTQSKLKKEYVLFVAQELLLKPLTEDYPNYQTAIDAVCQSWAAWDYLEHYNDFPAIEKIREKLADFRVTQLRESYTASGRLFAQFRANATGIMSKIVQDGFGIGWYSFFQSMMVAKYLSITQMQTDFNGTPWDDSGSMTQAERDALLKELKEKLHSSENNTETPIEIASWKKETKCQIDSQGYVLYDGTPRSFHKQYGKESWYPDNPTLSMNVKTRYGGEYTLKRLDAWNKASQPPRKRKQ